MISRFPPKFHYALTSLKEFISRGGFRQKSYSQQGEDVLLGGKIFANTKDGFYVDVGACHPLQGSNTHFFYKRGWHGINVEPNPEMKKYFNIFRRRDITVTAGIGKVDGKMDYYMFAGPGVNSFDNGQVERKKDKVPFLKKISVPVYTLSTLFKKYQVKNIDILSVDAENFDLDVLASNDWNIWRPRVVIVEDNAFSLSHPEMSQIYSYMLKQKYSLYSVLAQNLIFLRND